MNDLHNRFRSLNDIQAPDLWHEAEVRAQAMQRRGSRPLSWALIALMLLLALAIGSAALIGSGVVKLPALVDESVMPSSTPSSTTPAPEVLVGGGLMLVHSAELNADGETLDVFTLNVGTAELTLLGTLPSGTYGFQWGADRRHVLIKGSNSAGPTPLDNQTDAGRQLIFICCELPEEPVAFPSGQGKPDVTMAPAGGWVLSPQNDRIAGVHGRLINPSVCLLCSVIDAVVVMDGDGGNLHTLPLPEGTQGVEGPISWSPDGSAVLISGCRPCNNARYSSRAASLVTDPSKLTPTAVEHAHLYIVPVDGSPVQELLDETETTFFAAAWSPDATRVAFSSYVCPSDEHAPYCYTGTGALETFDVAAGQRTVIADQGSAGLAWSPDGRRIAFVAVDGIFVMDRDGSQRTKVSPNGEQPRWSPDGQWLVFSIHGEELRAADVIPWIVPLDGGEPRLLGPYGGWGW